MRHYTEALKAGAFALGAPTDHTLEVTGAPPEDFESIARRYIADPALIHPALRTGSKLGAFAFLARMLATRVPDLDAHERRMGHPLLRHPVPAHDNPVWREAAGRRELDLLGGGGPVARDTGVTYGDHGAMGRRALSNAAAGP